MKTMSAAEYRSEVTAPKRAKYGNKKVVVDGIEFDSIAESKHYSRLKILEMAGEITDIQLQVPFALTIGGFLICTFRADFTYITCKDNKFHVIDVKGVRTREFIIKKKLMKAILGIEIEEVRA